VNPGLQPAPDLYIFFPKIKHAALNLFVYKKMTLEAWCRSYKSELLDFVFPFCVHKFSPGLWRKLLKSPEVIYLVICYASPWMVRKLQ